MSRLNPRHSLVFISCILALAFRPVLGQQVATPTPEEIQAAESAPLFSSLEVFDLTLEADFHTIRREDRSPEDIEERPAMMRWTEADGSARAQEIQVQTRGRFRLDRRNCDFPPLRLNVKKEPSKGTLFEGQDKLKLVGACKLGQTYWEQYVLSEYLVYRMFNLFTPLSFRVRLAKVTYIDTSGEDETFTRHGFLIEDNENLAIRNGGVKIDWDMERDFLPNQLRTDQAVLVDVFQYMIGNTDWSGVRMHNVELLQIPMAIFVTVPFDFDFSGIVDARYAKPDERFRGQITRVRDRLFRGICPEQIGRTRADYEPIYEEFRQKKEEIYGLWRNQEGLEEDRVKETLEYLDEFYEILSDPREIKEKMMDKCRKVGG